MYLCYIDESGNTGNNLQDIHQPFLVLTALLIPAEHIRGIENDVRELGYKYFSAESRNTDFEFHGDDIYNARGRYFKKIPLERRINIMTELVDIVIKHESISVGYICIDKERYFAKAHIQQLAFGLLVEKIEEYLKKISDSYCVLIADEQDEIEQNLIDDLDYFKQHGIDFFYNKLQRIDHIIDSVHFVQSKNNFPMQLTDVACYIIKRGKKAEKKLREAYEDCNSEVSFEDWVNNDGYKGYKYSYRSYLKLAKERSWIFSVDFFQVKTPT